MNLRRSLLANVWLQLLLVAVIVVLANTWSARTFTRVDLTADRVYSLDLTTRALMYRLEKPLVAKVYFTGGLQAPYNNHEQIVVDKLQDLRAYSKGLMDVQVVDPTNVRELEDEAQRFGIQPIQYRYRSASVSELKKVFMGVALVYGEKQEVLPAITQTETLEYDLARAIKALVSEEDRQTIGFTVGSGEPNMLGGDSRRELLKTRLAENYDLQAVELGGAGAVPEEVDALMVVGPQRPMSERALYQLDQFLMRGGSVAVFISNVKPDMRTLRPQNVYHGMEALLGSYGVQVNRDLVVDRTQNGRLPVPVLQGKRIVQIAVNHPVVPEATDLSSDSLVVKDLDSMLFPFVSSITLDDPLPPEVRAEVLARSSAASGRIKGVRTLDPNAYKLVDPAEERGPWPLLVSLTGTWPSYFADKEIPDPPADLGEPPDDQASRLRDSAPTRLVVAGSADFIANNIPFVLNLADWLVQDESLIGIRSKVVSVPTLQPIEPSTLRWIKAANLLAGSAALLVIGLLRWALRRRSGGFRDEDQAGAAK